MAHLVLDNEPLLTNALSQGRPDLLAQAHVLLGQLLQFAVVPIVRVLTFHQAFVAFATGVGGLVGELVLDLLLDERGDRRRERARNVVGDVGAQEKTLDFRRKTLLKS